MLIFLQKAEAMEFSGTGEVSNPEAGPVLEPHVQLRSPDSGWLSMFWLIKCKIITSQPPPAH